MNLFLDTATEDFCLILFDDNFNVIDNVFITDQKKKVDLIISSTEQILAKNSLKIQDIKGLYTNIGPGFFTGIRSSFIYFRTIALMLKTHFFVTNSFALLQKQFSDASELYLDAQGKKMYFLKPSQNINSIDVFDSIKVVDLDLSKLQKIDFQKLTQNFAFYKDCFKETDPMSVEPQYVKKPQIGGN